MVIYALQWSQFQTDLSQRAATWLSNKLGSTVSVGNVRISWLDEIYLEDVVINDLENRDMIYVREVYVNAKSNFKFLQKDKFFDFDNNLDYIALKNPDVKIIKEKDGKLNIDKWIQKVASLAKKNKKKGGPAPGFTIDEAIIEDGTFTMIDPSKKRMPKELFDYFNFTIDNLNGIVKDFYVKNDIVTFNGSNINGVDKRSDLTIHDIKTDFYYSKKQIELKNLRASINNSTLTNYLGMFYDKPVDLNDFNHKVTLKASLRNSIIDFQDLGRFSTNMYQYRDILIANADVVGKVSDLYVTNANLDFGSNSNLNGKFHFVGLPDIRKTDYHVELNKGNIAAIDVKQYAGDENYNKYVQQIGNLTMSGVFKGTADDFYADAKLNSSELGFLNGKVNYTYSPLLKRPEYNLELTEASLNLGTITGNKQLFQEVTFNGKIKGAGNDFNTTALTLDGSIDALYLKGYNYKNIRVDGKLRQSIFDGYVAVNDPNLEMAVEGVVDLDPDRRQQAVKGNIERANLKALGFAKDDLVLETNFDIDFEGDKIDNWLGKATFTNTYVSGADRNLVVDEITLNSDLINGKRYLSVLTEFFDASIFGDFVPTTLGQDLSVLVKEYALFFNDSEEQRNEYYANKKNTNEVKDYGAKYEVKLLNMKNFFDFFYPDVAISEGGKITGDINIRATSQFSVYAALDTINYKGNYFYDNELDFYSSKNATSPDVLTSLILLSKEQKLANNAETKSLELNGSWGSSRRLDFDAGIRQKNTTNKAQVYGQVNFLEEGFDIALNPRNSTVNLLDYQWKFDKSNLVSVRGQEVEFESFRVSNQDQEIALSGFISPDSSKQLFAAVNKFDLRALKPILDLDLKGVADGDISISNYYGSPIFLSNVNVVNLTYKDMLVGDINGVVDWDNLTKLVKINTKITRENQDILRVEGNYDPNASEGMDLTAILDKADLEIVQPFIDLVFSDIKGTANGRLKITGAPRDPNIRGEVAINNGQLKINATGSYLYFNDAIRFTEEGFVAKKGGFKVYDAPINGHEAYIEGGVFNGGSGYFMLGLHAYMKDPNGFMLLNTDIKDNDTFYGKAHVTGDVHITGDFQNVNIAGNILSKRDSKITIPLDGANSIDFEEDAIPFAANPNLLAADSLNLKGNQGVSNGGVRLSLNLTLTPDAEVEIIFDRTNNDKLNAFGNGRISMIYDTRNGEFTMSGPYEVTSGKYDFSFQNLASLRKFEILEGSRISWSGDPYGANLSVKAAYQASVDLNDIIDENDNSRYPVNVVVNISDQLQSPVITYELTFDDTQIPTRYQTSLLSFQQRLRDDEQLLSRNVSSVIAFNKVLSENNTQAAFDQQFIISNVNSLLSNQIGNLASKLDPNLEVGVLLGDFRQNLLNNMQVNFSYKLMNNRIKLSGKSSYSVSDSLLTTNYNVGQLSVGGEIEYLLSADGMWRLRVHSRSVPFSNYTIDFTTGNVMVSGLNVIFSRNFNSFTPAKDQKSKPVTNRVPVGVGRREEDNQEVSLVP